ncbi:discoidin domain-containing protein [Haloferula sp.]|uniref:galactose-binding domain-containing protein n=1 Tax=Haloferula sp. TaxID=2497595 RepID=UPI00329FA9EA
MNRLVSHFLAAGMLIAPGLSILSAADITWGTVVDYSDPSDVSTAGVLVEAINATGITGATSPTVNGVTFTADPSLLGNDATTDFLNGDTGDLDYNQLLNSLDYDSSATIQIGGGLLQSGKEYLVQAWYVDERSSSDARAMQFGDGASPTENLSGEVNDQYVTGTFIADGTSQTFTVNGVTSGPHFNAYQLRDLSSAVPTLATTAGETVSGSFSLTIDFSESVSGLVSGDFTVTNATVSNVSGSGTSWTCDINPTSNGDVQVTLPANAVLDVDNHGNVTSNSILTTYVAPGSDQPLPTLSTTATDVFGAYTVQVDFSETVTGLELSDFAISGGTASNLSGSGTSYTILVTPNFGGDVTVSLPRNSVTDSAGDGDNLKNVDSNELTNAYFVVVNVSSPADLLPYMTQDNVTATLDPGTYTIDAADVNSTFGTPRFEIWGSNSTYDFTGVTINFAPDIYDSNLSMNHFQIYGNDNVLKNLTMVDLCDKYGTAGKSGGVNIIMDGSNNRLEGFHMTIRGSYPYGYGDCFGKGGSYTIKHWKHSGLLVRGESNHVLNCTLMQESYGHCIFMQAASNPTIEGCYVEAETRTTDDMLAETSGPAFDINFMTVWGFTLPAGYTKSTCEGGIRAYNGGNTYIDGSWYSRGTSNPTILNNTLVNTRTGVTLTHASGTRYVSGCTTIGTERGYAIGSGIIENCFSDVKHGPAFGVDYDSDSGITADITIIPHEGSHYNGSKHVAYITGNNHNITFRGVVQNPELDLEVNMGGDRRIESSSNVVDDYLADNIVLNNLTGYPLILDDNSDGNSGQSIGTITDAGTSNSFGTSNWGITSNLALYGKATQSSNAYGTIASIATDQNTDGIWSNGSVTHTNNEFQPWWKIDLEGLNSISEIKIWNRTDSNQDRLSDFDVTILDENEQPVWTNYQASSPNPSLSLLPNTTGQYVLIQLRGTDPLSLAEVEIFGTVIDGPGGLAAVANSGQIDLSWNAVADATSYTAKRSTTSGGPYTDIGTTAGTTFPDSTALDGILYHYVVTATVDGSESGPSSEVSSTNGIDPAKFTIVSGDITASTYQDPNVPANTVDGNLDPDSRWSANGDPQWIRYDLGAEMSVHYLKMAVFNGDVRTTNFDVEVSNDDTNWTPVLSDVDSLFGSLALETYAFTPTMARYVRIVGHGNSSSSWNSITEVEIWGTIPAPPAVPTDLTPTPDNGQVTLTWTESDGATMHHLKRSLTDGSGYVTIASVAGGSYVDSGMSNGTTYYYVISAENVHGESAESAQVSAKPYAPVAPEELAGPTMTQSGNNLDLVVESSVLGRIYQLQRNESLDEEGWNDVGLPVTGTGGKITLPDDPGALLLPKCFYRLQIIP